MKQLDMFDNGKQDSIRKYTGAWIYRSKILGKKIKLLKWPGLQARQYGDHNYGRKS